jgi:HK97 gp10 family phage protein
MDFKFTSNREEIEKEAEKAIQRALEAIGLQAEGYAKMNCTVDTGLLRNSITHAVSGESFSHDYKSNNGEKSGQVSGTIGHTEDNSVFIGSNVEYAPFVEMGTSKMKAQPFLKPAITEHTNEYKQIAEHYLKGDD